MRVELQEHHYRGAKYLGTLAEVQQGQEISHLCLQQSRRRIQNCLPIRRGKDSCGSEEYHDIVLLTAQARS